VRGGFFGAEMVHPRFRKVGDDEAAAGGNDPDLPVDRRIGQFGAAEADRRALAVGDLSDTLPDELRQRLKLPGPGPQPALSASAAAGHRSRHLARTQSSGLAAGEV
jgi:hypothetical protein